MVQKNSKLNFKGFTVTELKINSIINPKILIHLYKLLDQNTKLNDSFIIIYVILEYHKIKFNITLCFSVQNFFNNFIFTSYIHQLILFKTKNSFRYMFNRS